MKIQIKVTIDDQEFQAETVISPEAMAISTNVSKLKVDAFFRLLNAMKVTCQKALIKPKG